MNIKMFFLCLAATFSVVCAGNAIGQTATTDIQYFPTSLSLPDDAIGRVASDGKYIITSHIVNNRSRFIWTDVTNYGGKYFDLDTLQYIYDFERIGDTVFFCGRYDTTGMVGYFTESIFSSGTGSIKIVLIPDASNLSKMEVYADNNLNCHIVAAVGIKGIYSNNPYSVILNCEFGSASATYNVCSINPDRLYQDIAVTDSYIVAVGVYQPSLDQIALSVIDKNNLLQMHYCTPTETAGNMNSLMYSIKHLDKDDVAISTLVSHQASPTYFSSPVHIFDASTFTFINSQRVPLLDKAAYYNEMLYYPEYQTLLLLQTNYYPDNSTKNSLIYYLKPYATYPYGALVIYTENTLFYSLDRFPNEHFLATGKLKTDYHAFMAHDSQAQPKFDCLESDYESIDIISSPTCSTYNIPLLSNTVNYKIYSPLVKGIQSSEICVQK